MGSTKRTDATPTLTPFTGDIRCDCDHPHQYGHHRRSFPWHKVRDVALKVVGAAYLCLACAVCFMYGALLEPGLCDNPFLMSFLLVMGTLGLTTYLMITATFDITQRTGRCLVWLSRLMVMVFFVMVLIGNLFIAFSPPSILYKDCGGGRDGDNESDPFHHYQSLHILSLVTLLMLDLVTIGAVTGLCCLYAYLICMMNRRDYWQFFHRLPLIAQV